jgi:multidrug efflux system membrane fusion protein
VVSTSAIERGQQGSFVYVVAADNTVSAKTVTLGITEGEHVAVLTGVNPGDKVVVDGADRLKDGMVVDPQFPTQAAGGGAGAGGSGRTHGAWNKDGKGGPPKLGPDGKPLPSDGEHRHWTKPAGDSN